MSFYDRYLVTRGAFLNLETKMRRNVLHIVAEEGSLEIMAWLLMLLEEKDLLRTLIDVQDRYNGVDLCFLIRGRDKGRCVSICVNYKIDYNT